MMLSQIIYIFMLMVRYCRMLSDVVIYCQMLSDVVRLCHMLSNVVRCCQMLSYVVRCCQMLSYVEGVRWRKSFALLLLFPAHLYNLKVFLADNKYVVYLLELMPFYRTRVRSLAMLVTHSLTHSLTNWLPFSKLDWCDPGMWRWQLKTCWSCYCCWCWWWGSCWQQSVTDLGADVWS